MTDEDSELDLVLKEKFKKYKCCILVEYLASRLNDEQVISKYYNKIITVKYRDLRRKEKCQELKQSMLDLINSARNCIEFKNQIVNLYDKRLTDFDEIHKHTFDNFLILKDDLIRIFKFKIEYLKQNYLKEIESIKFGFKNEINKLYELHVESLKDIDYQMVCYDANAYEINRVEMNKGKHEFDQLQIRFQDDKIVFRIECEKKLKQLESDYFNEKKNYENNLLIWRRPDALNSKAEKLDKIILNDKCKIKILLNKIKKIKDDFNTYDFRLLEDKKKFLHLKIFEYNQYFKHKTNQSINRKDKLSKLVNQSSKAIENLNSKNEKLSKIIKFLRLCTKNESIQSIKYNNAKNYNNLDIVCLFNVTNTQEINLEFIQNELEYNSSNLNAYNGQLAVEIKSLQLEQLNLKKENVKLRHLLRKYMSSVKN